MSGGSRSRAARHLLASLAIDLLANGVRMFFLLVVLATMSRDAC